MKPWDGHSSAMEIGERRGEYEREPKPAPSEYDPEADTWSVSRIIERAKEAK